jgi:hypothetical protein
VLADPVTELSLPLAVTRPITVGYRPTTDYLVQSCPVDGVSLRQDRRSRTEFPGPQSINHPVSGAILRTEFPDFYRSQGEPPGNPECPSGGWSIECYRFIFAILSIFSTCGSLSCHVCPKPQIVSSEISTGIVFRCLDLLPIYSL